MEIVYFIIGLLIGAAVVYLALRSKGAVATALLEAERTAREQELADLRKSYEQQQAEVRRSYEQQLNLFREQVTTATERLLKERSGELQQANTQTMDELFRPLRDNIQRMEQAMNANRVASAEGQTRFEDAVRMMMESTTRLGTQADRLSTALQRKNKVTGNWGELILSELLESMGLQPDVHFTVQKGIREEDTGAVLIPDVVLHLADNRDVVIDSKMSMTAFVDYQNAEDEVTRQDALTRHILSVRNHIDELARKNYSDSIKRPRVSIGFVIMFVPIEGALQLALSDQPKLWREAFERKVFIASGQTLMAALRIIDLTWVNVLQERNTQKVMDEARKLIDRVSMFYKEFQTVGQRLTAAQEAYVAVEKRVDGGSQSILSLGHHLENLGARGKKSLPRPESTDIDEDDNQ